MPTCTNDPPISSSVAGPGIFDSRAAGSGGGYGHITNPRHFASFILSKMAERGGFEPPRVVTPYTISSRAVSTAHAPLQRCDYTESASLSTNPPCPAEALQTPVVSIMVSIDVASPCPFGACCLC